jgi:hypothetical protein
MLTGLIFIASLLLGELGLLFTMLGIACGIIDPILCLLAPLDVEIY